jgi:hypothetical protein
MPIGRMKYPPEEFFDALDAEIEGSELLHPGIQPWREEKWLQLQWVDEPFVRTCPLTCGAEFVYSLRKGQQTKHRIRMLA